MGQGKVKQERKQLHQVAESSYVKGFTMGVTYLMGMFERGAALPATVVHDSSVPVGEYAIHAHPSDVTIVETFRELARVHALLETKNGEDEARREREARKEIDIQLNNQRIEHLKAQREQAHQARLQYGNDVIREAEKIVQDREEAKKKAEALLDRRGKTAPEAVEEQAPNVPKGLKQRLIEVVSR